MVKQTFFIAACIAGLGLQACENRAANPAKVEAEVQKAQAEGEKKIVEAQAKLEQVNAENKKDVAVASADTRIDAAQEMATKADAKKPGAAEPSPSVVDESVAKAHVAAMQKSAEAQYAVDKAKAEATYGVTLARCKGQSSEDTQAICRDGAQKTLASAVANAKARNDAAKRRAAMASGSKNG